jgi:putative phage-type endonuclease
MSTEVISPIVGPLSYSPEWYDAERTYIGASQAAAACGMSQYDQPRGIYLELRGERPRKAETQAMKIGKELEPVTLNLYSHEKGCAVGMRQPLYRHPELTFIGATPDALAWLWGMTASLDGAVGPESPDTWVVEAKSTNEDRARREIKDPEAEEVPLDWLFQCQQQMLVLGKPFVDLAVLVGNREFRIIRITRNEELLAQIIDAEQELWERAQKGLPPPIDYRHPGALDLIRSTYKLDESQRVLLPQEIATCWREYEQLGKQATQIEKDRDALKARVLDFMGDAATGFHDDSADSLTLRRSLVVRKAYSVKETSYTTIRRRKS